MSVAALLVGVVGTPAGAQTVRPVTGTLPSGMAYEVRADREQATAAIALWYRAPSSGFDPAPMPGLSRLAAETVAGSTPITGTTLGRLVQRAGGRLSISAYPDSVAITALVAPDRVAQVVRALTGDYFAPVIDAAGLQTAQRDLAEDAAYRSYDPSAVIEDALGSVIFADGPFHETLIPRPQNLRAVPLARVRTFAERAFRPANAVLVLAGNVDVAALNAVATRDGAQASAESPVSSTVRPAPEPASREAAVEGTGLGWAGPPIADEAAATAMDFLADALFAPRTGVVQKALAKRKTTVTGRFVTYHNPGTFLVTISGEDAAAVVPLVEQAIADAAKPMPATAFASSRAIFVYHLLSQMESPAELADTYGWYAVEGAPAYAPAEGGTAGRYFSLAAAMTPEAVAQIARRYLAAPPAVVMVSKAKPATGKPA